MMKLATLTIRVPEGALPKMLETLTQKTPVMNTYDAVQFAAMLRAGFVHMRVEDVEIKSKTA